MPPDSDAAGLVPIRRYRVRSVIVKQPCHFHILMLEKVAKTGYNFSCPRETHSIKEENPMCFDICSIWQLLCRMGGFGC